MYVRHKSTVTNWLNKNKAAEIQDNELISTVSRSCALWEYDQELWSKFVKAKQIYNSFRSPRASLQNLRVNVFFLKLKKKIPLVFHLQKSM